MLLSDLLEPPLPSLPCSPIDFQNGGVPLALVQLYPVVLLSPSSSQSQNETLIQQCFASSQRNLSSPMVKIFLQDVCKNQSMDLRILWDDADSSTNCKKSRIQVLSGWLSKGKVQCDAHWKRSLLYPIIMIPSSDPTNHDGMPCVVRVFSMAHVYQENTKANEYTAMDDKLRITNGTLVQIVPSVMCDWISDKHEICRIVQSPVAPVRDLALKDEMFSRNVSLIHELSGILSVHQDYDDKDVLLGYEEETVRALTIRMNSLLQRRIMVGTTVDATRQWNERMNRRRRMSKAFDRIFSAGSKPDRNACNDDNERIKGPNETLVVVDSFPPADGALTVHNPIHGSGKTTLVATIAATKLRCQAVHIIHAPTLFAKYGASGADAALESLLHAAVVSAAVRGICTASSTGRDKEGSICIILDHLESFVPPSMMGAYNDGDPAIPTLNSIRKCLSGDCTLLYCVFYLFYKMNDWNCIDSNNPSMLTSFV